MSRDFDQLDELDMEDLEIIREVLQDRVSDMRKGSLVTARPLKDVEYLLQRVEGAMTIKREGWPS